MITIAIINVLAWTIAAVCKAVMDTLQFRFDESIFNRLSWTKLKFWNPEISWKNKYKRRNVELGERFWGSTTIFVFVTDAWHLFQFGMNLFIAITLVTAIYLGNNEMKLYQYILFFILYRILWGLTFEIFYRKLLIRK